MKKRMRYMLSVLVAGMGLTLSLTVGTAAAATPNQTDRTAREAIHCGLWSGVNFDISGKCPEQTPAQPANPTVPTQSSGKYVALGDSVAAGLGLPADQGSGVCSRSSEGYPNIVAANLNMPLTNASCSGATAGDLFTRQSVDGPDITAQLDTAFAAGKPQLITITAGANDVRWAEFIRACYAADCTRSGYDYAARAYLAAMRAKLEYALADIRWRSGGQPPRVVLTGYYNPLSAACSTLQQDLTAAEISWLSGQLNRLNQTIRETGAKYSNVRFAAVNFSGHDICSQDPWVQGPNDAAPFHPTAVGQQAIARTVTAAAR